MKISRIFILELHISRQYWIKKHNPYFNLIVVFQNIIKIYSHTRHTWSNSITSSHNLSFCFHTMWFIRKKIHFLHGKMSCNSKIQQCVFILFLMSKWLQIYFTQRKKQKFKQDGNKKWTNIMLMNIDVCNWYYVHVLISSLKITFNYYYYYYQERNVFFFSFTS